MQELIKYDALQWKASVRLRSSNYCCVCFLHDLQTGKQAGKRSSVCSLLNAVLLITVFVKNLISSVRKRDVEQAIAGETTAKLSMEKLNVAWLLD